MLVEKENVRVERKTDVTFSAGGPKIAINYDREEEEEGKNSLPVMKQMQEKTCFYGKCQISYTKGYFFLPKRLDCQREIPFDFDGIEIEGDWMCESMGQYRLYELRCY